MCQIALSIPDEVLYDTKMSHEQANQFARQAVALGYYTQSGVSIGYCSQIAGMTEEEFIKYLCKIIYQSSGLMMKKNSWRSWIMRKVVVNSTPLIILPVLN